MEERRKDGERIARLEAQIESQEEKINNLRDTLHGRIKNEATHLKEQMATELENIKEQQKVNTAELTSLKAWKNWTMGIGASIGVVIGLIGNEFWKKISG